MTVNHVSIINKVGETQTVEVFTSSFNSFLNSVCIAGSELSNSVMPLVSKDAPQRLIERTSKPFFKAITCAGPVGSSEKSHGGEVRWYGHSPQKGRAITSGTTCSP